MYVRFNRLVGTKQRVLGVGERRRGRRRRVARGRHIPFSVSRRRGREVTIVIHPSKRERTYSAAAPGTTQHTDLSTAVAQHTRVGHTRPQAPLPNHQNTRLHDKLRQAQIPTLLGRIQPARRKYTRTTHPQEALPPSLPPRTPT